MEKSLNLKLADYEKSLKEFKAFIMDNKGQERTRVYETQKDRLLRKVRSYEKAIKDFGIGNLWLITGKRMVKDLSGPFTTLYAPKDFSMYVVGCSEVELQLFIETLVNNKTQKVIQGTIIYKFIKTREFLP